MHFKDLMSSGKQVFVRSSCITLYTAKLDCISAVNMGQKRYTVYCTWGIFCVSVCKSLKQFFNVNGITKACSASASEG